MILTATREQRFRIAPGDRFADRRYGLLAPWRGHGGKRPPPIVVAREAEIAATPVLRKALRLALPCDGFYATAKVAGAIHAWWCTGGPLEVLAATHADDAIPSFCVLVAPSELPHIPLAPLGRWRPVEVSRRFEKHDDAGCVAPLGNPNQGSLF